MNTLSKSMLAMLGTLAALPAQSQIYKGATFIGGNLGLKQRSERPIKTQDDRNTSYFSAYLNPKAGWYLTNKLAVGINLHFGFMNIENSKQNPVYNKQNSYTSGGSVFIRYTQFIIPKLAFFTEGNIGYMHTWNKSEEKIYATYQVDRVRTNNFAVAIVPGIIFMATPSLGFEASYGSVFYSYRRNDVEKQRTQSLSAPSMNISEFGFDLSSSTLSIGFNYYFGNRPRVKVEVSDED
ncbi:MAG TPA: hypothetical protein VL092_10210 [Chitinophagaceae bacterium]|nr:hypothetical protein [Chitinophagaceae bacterium]